MLQCYDHRRGGRLAGAHVAVDRIRVEVNRIPCLHVMRHLAVPNVEGAREQIKKLAANMLVGSRRTALFFGEELRKVWIELTVGNQIPQALEEIGGIVCASLRQTYPVVAAMHPK